MGSEFETAMLIIRKKRRRSRSMRARPMSLQPVPAAAAILLGLGSSANAQAIPWANGEFASPWNAQKIFEPSSLPDRTDPETAKRYRPRTCREEATTAWL
jgi:hypothetical protein